MVGVEALRRVAQEIEDRAHRLIDEDALRTRLTRDLARTRLYVKAVQSGYAQLVPERLYRELLERYRPPSPDADPTPTDGESTARQRKSDAPRE